MSQASILKLPQNCCSEKEDLSFHYENTYVITCESELRFPAVFVQTYHDLHHFFLKLAQTSIQSLVWISFHGVWNKGIYSKSFLSQFLFFFFSPKDVLTFRTKIKILQSYFFNWNIHLSPVYFGHVLILLFHHIETWSLVSRHFTHLILPLI